MSKFKTKPDNKGAVFIRAYSYLVIIPIPIKTILYFGIRLHLPNPT